MLINRNFSLLWIGQIISQIGDKFYAIALAWWILEKTNSPSLMGAFLIASMLPELLLGPIAGGFIDKWNRKIILVVSDLLRGGLVVAVALLSWQGMLELWHVLTAAVGISLGSAFFNPTVKAVIPQLVEKDDLPHANALSQLIMGITTVIGPVLGAVFVGFFGFTLVFLINGVSYIVSAYFEGITNIPQTAGHMKASRVSGNIKEGFAFVLSNKRVFTILVAIGVGHFFIGGLMVIMPFLAKQLAGSGVQNLGYLETTIGVGIVAGSILVKARKDMAGDYLLFGAMTAVGVWFLFIGTLRFIGVSFVIPFAAISFLIGASIAIASVYWQSLLQLNTDNEMAGRVFSISTTLGNAFFPIAFGLFGVLLSRFSITNILMSNGVGLIIVSVMLMLAFRRSIKSVTMPL